MTRVVFHLGDKKTGSTAIQTALASGAIKCESQKLLYPGDKLVSHIALAKALQRPKVSAAQIAAQFASLLAEIEENKPDVAVISAEAFEDVDPAVLKRAVQQHMPAYAETARYIAYVRPHSERLTSDYAERVKAGYLGSMEDLFQNFQKSRLIEYTPRFLTWRASFGSRFELRPMIRSLLYKNDVVQDLVQFVLGSDEFTVGEIPNVNEAVPLENLSILRKMHLAMQGDAAKRGDFQKAFGRDMARRMHKSAIETGTKVQIHRSLAQAVLADFAEDAAKLDAEFFAGTPMTDNLKAAPGKAVADAQSFEMADHFSPREQYLINLWIDQITTLVGADPEKWARILRSGHKVEVLSAGEAEVEDTPAPASTPKPKRNPAGRRRVAAGAAPGGGRAGGPKGGKGLRRGRRQGKAAKPEPE